MGYPLLKLSLFATACVSTQTTAACHTYNQTAMCVPCGLESENCQNAVFQNVSETILVHSS
jgi:hypothetical protein